MKPEQLPQLRFVLRHLLPEGGVRYSDITPRTPEGSLHTAHAPAVGDFVPLHPDDGDIPSGVFRVIWREWYYPSWGSVVWRYASDELPGPRYTIAVERCEAGPYADESPLLPRERDDEEEE